MDLCRVGYEMGDQLMLCSECKEEFYGTMAAWRCESCAETVLHNVLHPKDKYYPKFEKPVDYDTARFYKHHCGDCGWPVLHVCTNAAMGEVEPYKGWDWWNYCTNKACKNHEGEGVFQHSPDWVIKSE